MIGAERDSVLRRLERDAVACCAGAAAVALVLQRGDPGVALGILGGGALVGASYWAIKGAIDGLLARTVASRAGRRPPSAARALLRLVGRYALLGIMAYVMIARFRLHPVGLLAGASSIVAAAAIEAGRAIMGPGPRDG